MSSDADMGATLASRFAGELAGKLPAFAKQLLAFLDNDGAAADGGTAAGAGLSKEDCKFPMWVIPIASLIEVTGRDGDLPCHEDLMDEGLLVEYDPSTMSKCLFYSHTWLRFAHPDSADGVKKKLIHELSKGIVEGTVAFHAYWFAVVAHHMKDLPAQDVTAKYKDCHVWLDYISIPQRDRGTQGLAIQSIPYYVGSTHEFIVLAGPWLHENGSVRDLLAWNRRGWCRMEQVSNALSPKVKPVICAASASSVKNHGCAEILGRMWFNETVGKGDFAVEADRMALGPVIDGMISRRQAQAERQGDLVWYRALEALKSTLLAGTEMEEEAPEETRGQRGRALDTWMQRMRFASVVDGAATGHTPLRYAVMAGRVDLVEQILACMKILANEDSQPVPLDVDAPLAASAEELQFNMMPQMTILHAAAMSQHGERAGEIVRLLLAAKADARATCSAQRWSPLHLAVTSDGRAAISALMEHDPTLRDAELMAGIRPFQRCAIGGQPETMRWLLQTYGEYITPELPGLSAAGMSWALAACFEENSAEMLEVLLEHGAAVNADDGSWVPAPMKKLPPLKFVFLEAIVPTLLRAQRPSALIEHFGNALATTPLHAAAITGNLRSLKVLLKAGCAVDGPRAQLHITRATPVHCAAMGGHRTVCDTLLDANPSLVGVRDRFGHTPAWWAERRGHADLARRLRDLEEEAGVRERAKAAERRWWRAEC